MNAGARTGGLLSLGPVLFHWPAEQMRDFYFRMADEAPVDSIHVGEVVCSKREPFFGKYFVEVLERIAASGKQAVVSSLALVMSEKERHRIKALAGTDVVVEANDLSAVAVLGGHAFQIGPFVNVYNEGTLAYLVGLGARSVCLPAELPAAAIAVLASHGLCEIEVQAFGRLPLAMSARCYHARSRDLHKDGCQYVCSEDADGMAVDTLDGQEFLAVNGTQTMSGHYVNLLGQLGDLTRAGVGRFRLWPHSCDMVAVAELYRAVLDGRLDGAEAARRLADLVPEASFANGYIHGCEGHRLIEDGLTICQ